MSRSSAMLRKRSLASHRVTPPCPDDVPEFQWVALTFDRHCQVFIFKLDIPSRFLTSCITGELCLNSKASESQAIWIARIRMCHDCARKK